MSRIFKPVSDIREEKRKHRLLTRTKIAVVAVFCLVLLYVLLAYSGHWIVKDEQFGHATWAVILDGQSGDLERSDYAAELVREGRVDSLLVLGRRVFRDRSNADFYAEDLVDVGGIDPKRIFIFRHDDPSTLEEAVTIVPWLKKRAAGDTVLLITGAPATRRASFIFKTLTGESLSYVTTDLHDWRYNADGWALERESRKNWLREWAAILYAHWELWGVDTLDTPSQRSQEPIHWSSQGKAESPKSVAVKPEKLLSIRAAIAAQDSTVRKERESPDISQSK